MMSCCTSDGTLVIASKLVDPAGNPLPSVALETAGSVSLTIVADNGTKVKKFSEPIDLTIDINPTTKSPKTGEVVKEGDSIPLFSRDEETGVYTLEGNAVVRKAPNSNKLVANVKVPHLSDWELAFYSNSPNGSCDAPSVTINANTSAGIFITLYNTLTGQVIYHDYYNLVQGPNVIKFVSQDKNVIAEITGLRIGKTISSMFPLCGGNAGIDLDIEQFDEVDIKIKAVCPAPSNRTIYPSFPVYYKETGNGEFDFLGDVVNGRITTNVFKAGRSVTFGTEYEGKWYEYTRIIDKAAYDETMTLPKDNKVCK
jgi:hypothetical protein